VFPLSEAAAVSWHQTSAYVKLVADGLYGMVSGRISPREAAGPIYMGKIIEDTNNEILTSETVQNKPLTIFWTMLQFAAVISANLAVVNLLPIPALDGGRFVILAIEGIRRKPLNPERVGMVTFVSFAVLMLLAAAVAFSDILKLAA
jgi:regulator of sigma E protease